MGERVADRLDFEELALKSIDPSLGPTPVMPSASSSIPSSPTKELGTPVKASLVISFRPNTRPYLYAHADSIVISPINQHGTRIPQRNLRAHLVSDANPQEGILPMGNRRAIHRTN